MRLHPVINFTTSELTGYQVIGGWPLPAGTLVGTSIVPAHQRRDSYPDATIYHILTPAAGRRPERPWVRNITSVPSDVLASRRRPEAQSSEVDRPIRCVFNERG